MYAFYIPVIFAERELSQTAIKNFKYCKRACYKSYLMTFYKYTKKHKSRICGYSQPLLSCTISAGWSLFAHLNAIWCPQ